MQKLETLHFIFESKNEFSGELVPLPNLKSFSIYSEDDDSFWAELAPGLSLNLPNLNQLMLGNPAKLWFPKTEQKQVLWNEISKLQSLLELRLSKLDEPGILELQNYFNLIPSLKEFYFSTS